MLRALAFSILACVACSGAGDQVREGSEDDSGVATDRGPATGDTAAMGGTETSDAPTRLARLTHAQYENTIGDLFGIDFSVAQRLAPDALNGFDFDTSADLRVDARLGPQYRNVAEEVAAQVATDASALKRIAPCDQADAGCAASFVEQFGQRAFRRPLNDAERTRFENLFLEGPTWVGSGNAFADGVQLVVEAMLQSPQFLYRAELSTQAAADGRIPLNSWERASKLSYLILDSMPDEELFSLARGQMLDSYEQLQSAVTRLLAHERATAKIASFHAQAWQFGRFSNIAPDTQTYPQAPSDLASRARRAARAFVRDVVDQNGGLQEFLTAPYAYADAQLAPLYGGDAGGVMNAGDEPTRLELNPAERKGLFLQVPFLASHAYSAKTDPIHRGLFVLRYLLCRTVPDPPPGAAMSEAPSTDEPLETTREEISVLTGQPKCVGCHEMINAPGFAFENFDAAGQMRQMENGAPVDTTGQMQLDGQPVSFDGAVDLVDALAASGEARSCYAKRWAEFAFGRQLLQSEASATASLEEAGLGVKDILLRLTLSPEFLGRPSAALLGANSNEVNP